MKMAGLRFARILLIIVGCFFLLFYVGSLLALFQGDKSFRISMLVIGLIFFLAPGVLFLYTSKKFKEKIERARMAAQPPVPPFVPYNSCSGSRVSATMQHQSSQPNTAPSQPVPASCTGCGARVTLPQFGVVQCEYCGTSLSAASRSK